MSMQRNYFILDGKSSAEFGAYIATSNAFDGAEHDEEIVEIPGRNGALIFSNGRYKNVVAEIACYMPRDMRTNVDGLRSYLSTKHGYCRYEEAVKPNEYRLARFLGPFSLSASDRVGAAFTLSFDMKPQRFLKTGELPIRYTTNSTIYNPTLYTAEPRFRLVGTPGENAAFNIGGTRQIQFIFPESGSVTVDTAIGEAYDTDGTSLNNIIYFPPANADQYFPVIKPGENTVSMYNVDYVDIVPRWWTI